MQEPTQFKDYFSKLADIYARYRPTYPAALFDYLASIAPSHDLAWDCGTGNGQAALGLAPYFERVVATDPSEEQIRNAFPHDKIAYRVARAEDPGIEPASVDLVTVAQALHWFEIDHFFDQAAHALKPGGLLAFWCYTLCRISPEIDRLVDDFYSNRVGPYWPKERKLVDDAYASVVIPPPFVELQGVPDFSIGLSWTLDDLLGYLRSWSPTRRFIERNGYDPVDQIEIELAALWGDRAHERQVHWPLYLRVGQLPPEQRS